VSVNATLLTARVIPPGREVRIGFLKGLQAAVRRMVVSATDVESCFPLDATTRRPGDAHSGASRP